MTSGSVIRKYAHRATAQCNSRCLHCPNIMVRTSILLTLAVTAFLAATPATNAVLQSCKSCSKDALKTFGLCRKKPVLECINQSTRDAEHCYTEWLEERIENKTEKILREEQLHICTYKTVRYWERCLEKCLSTLDGACPPACAKKAMATLCPCAQKKMTPVQEIGLSLHGGEDAKSAGAGPRSNVFYRRSESLLSIVSVNELEK